MLALVTYCCEINGKLHDLLQRPVSGIELNRLIYLLNMASVIIPRYCSTCGQNLDQPKKVSYKFVEEDKLNKYKHLLENIGYQVCELERICRPCERALNKVSNIEQDFANRMEHLKALVDNCCAVRMDNTQQQKHQLPASPLESPAKKQKVDCSTKRLMQFSPDKSTAKKKKVTSSNWTSNSSPVPSRAPRPQ